MSAATIASTLSLLQRCPHIGHPDSVGPAVDHGYELAAIDCSTTLRARKNVRTDKSIIHVTSSVPATDAIIADIAVSTDVPKVLPAQQLRRGVVKITSSIVKQNEAQPWASVMEEKTSSGFLIEGNQIITPASGVADAVRVMLKKDGHTKKFLAKVIAVSHDLDLALLEVSDSEFHHGVAPVKMTTTWPDVQEPVTIAGFTTSEDTPAFSAGYIKDIGCKKVSHGRVSNVPTITYESAGSASQSGGIIVNQRNEILGMERSLFTVTPVAVIERFITAARANSKPGGTPMTLQVLDAGVSAQGLENHGMKKAFGLLEVKNLPAGVTAAGVLVNSIDEDWNKSVVAGLEARLQQVDSAHSTVKVDETLSERQKALICSINTLAAAGVRDVNKVCLRKGDVLLAVDGHDISDDGTVDFLGKARVNANAMINLRQLGEVPKAWVLRRGEVIEIFVPLRPRDLIVPPYTHDTKLRYIVYGGAVFAPMTRSTTRSTRMATSRLKSLSKKQPDEERVVLLDVLPCQATVGYQGFVPMVARMFSVMKIFPVLETVNGVEVQNLKHLASLLADKGKALPKAPSSVDGAEDGRKFVEFDFDQGNKLNFEVEEAEKATLEVMETMAIPKAQIV